jgi:hypothetical protein
MSMDVMFGLMYGVQVWDNILEDERIQETIEIPIFDKYTGKPKGTERRFIYKYKLLKTIIGVGKIGDLVTQEEFSSWIRIQANTINGNHNRGNFIYDWNGVGFFGIKAFVEEEPYLYPQDHCIEFVDNTIVAKELWEQFFPYLDGKLLLYMRVSV